MTINSPMISQIPQLRALWQEAFGDTDDFLNAFYSSAFDTQRCRCATDNGQIVAALYWFDCFCEEDKIAYLYAVATSKAYRGRGICHKLMHDTQKHLKNLGYKGIILVPGSKELFEFYGRMDYRICSYVKEIECSASDRPADIKQICKSEYAKYRRRFLPEHSVIQEKENLDFFEKQVNFYLGKDFLLAARKENNTLYAVELLGDTSAMPNIVKALNTMNGKFRTPGKERPFSMFLALEDRVISPKYFGLAFD